MWNYDYVNVCVEISALEKINIKCNNNSKYAPKQF